MKHSVIHISELTHGQLKWLAAQWKCTMREACERVILEGIERGERQRAALEKLAKEKGLLKPGKQGPQS